MTEWSSEPTEAQSGMTEWSSEPTEAQSGMTEWSSEERELPSDLSESPRDSATCRVHWSCLRAAPAIPRASARLGPTEQSITCRQGSVPCRRGRVPRGSSGRGFEGRGSDGDERGFAVDRDYSSRDARYSILHGRESAVGRERFMLARDRFVLARDGFVFAPAPFRLTTDQSHLDARGFALDRKESDLTGTPFHVDVRSFQRTERRLRVDAREMCVYAHQRRLGEQRFHGARGALSLARAALSVDTGVFDRNRNASALIRRWCELDAPESLLDRRSFDRDGREFHLRRRELE